MCNGEELCAICKKEISLADFLTNHIIVALGKGFTIQVCNNCAVEMLARKAIYQPEWEGDARDRPAYEIQH